MKLFLYPLILSLLAIQLPIHASELRADYDLSSKAQDYCSDLEEAEGIIIKFKKVNPIFGVRNLNIKSNAKLELKSILGKEINGVQQLYLNTKIPTNQLSNNNKRLNQRISKLQKLSEKYNLNGIYSIPASELGSSMTQEKPRAYRRSSEIIFACGSDLEKDLERLKNNPNIEYAEANIRIKLQNATDPFLNKSNSWKQGYEDLWGHKKLQAEEAWTISQGEGIKVAVIDTGVDYNHPDIWDNIWVNPALVSDRNADGKINLDDMDLNGNKIIDDSEFIKGAIGEDFINYGDVNQDSPIDEHGHGTHVAGTIAAVGNNGIGIVGIAPKAQIIPVQIFSANGYSSTSGIFNALIYATSVADIANNSWGGWGKSRTIEEAFRIAHEAGLINIVAAGNEEDDAEFYYPANYNNVITVSASTQTDKLAYFSNYGSVVDIAAPGGMDLYGASNILSLASRNHILLEDNPRAELKDPNTSSDTYTYARLIGTSMASPHIAGLAALILSKKPNYTFDDIRQQIMMNADSLNSTLPSGAGRANAFKTLKNLPADDLEPPSMIQSLQIKKRKTKNKKRLNLLSWSPASDNIGVNSYNIYRNNVLLSSTNQNKFIDKKIKSGRKYKYTIIATDFAGNQSTAITGY